MAAWLDARPEEPKATSELARVEVVRAIWRLNEDHVDEARDLVAALYPIPLTRGLLDRAAILGPAVLRSLEAIHLASALTLGAELTAFVAYDRRLQTAAEAERLPVFAPA